jgi:membrane-bound inhibitor of C-type lysozyme
VLTINGQTNELRQRPAGSGISYANEMLTFRAEGTNASIEEDGQVTYRNCRGQ